MTIIVNPLLNVDGYKLEHFHMYPENTEFIYSNWTARGSRIHGVDKVVFFGLQYALKVIKDEWDDGFFNRPEDEVADEYETFLLNYLGPDNGVGTDHVRELHRLGYLPLEFKALPEGTEVPIRVPMFTVENTDPRFYWLTNYIETILSARLWMPCTSATISLRNRRLLNEFAMKTCGSTESTAFQNHDFSMRGMSGLEAAIISGMGHLVASTGSDSLPAINAVQTYYPTNTFVGGGVPATEHSVQCAGGEDNEQETYERLLALYPTGILSVVSDTWDYWNVLTNLLPNIKDQIMARNGKLVIRPDSGDPADIICGTRGDVHDPQRTVRTAMGTESPQEKGSVEVLWDLFGGTVNEQGYKVLDPHIGLIYGDSMNYERIRDIMERLEAKGFASTNIVIGTGSYAYQYQTRDTFMFAMKATNAVINGVEKPIFKDPKTDSGTKKSLRGRVVVYDDKGTIRAADSTTGARSLLEGFELDLLTTVWKDGKFIKEVTFDEVRANALG